MPAFTQNLSLAQPAAGDTGWDSLANANLAVLDAAVTAIKGYPCACQTTNGTPTEMTIALLPLSRLTFQASSASAVDIEVIALKSDSTFAVRWTILALVRCDSGGTLHVDASVIQASSTTTTWTLTLAVDAPTKGLKVLATGSAATTINWAGTARQTAQFGNFAATILALPSPLVLPAGVTGSGITVSGTATVAAISI